MALTIAQHIKHYLCEVERLLLLPEVFIFKNPWPAFTSTVGQRNV